MSAQSKTFDFVKLVDLEPKPREKGVIEIRGPYYTSVSHGYLTDLLADWSEYIDGYTRTSEKRRVPMLINFRAHIALRSDFVSNVLCRGGL